MANTQNFSLEGKIALITGASYGIGYAIAKGMAKAGAKIVFNDIKCVLFKQFNNFCPCCRTNTFNRA